MVPVQRLRVGQLDRTQRGGGRGKEALEMGQSSLWELFWGNLEGAPLSGALKVMKGRLWE